MPVAGKTPRAAALLAAPLFAMLLSGCAGGGSSSPAPPSSASVRLATYADPWLAAVPRERDIANNLFAAGFGNAFDYGRASVTLSYARTAASYFRGHLAARGLKPNFAYQLKLAGKPVSGNRGTGTASSYVEADSLFPGARPILHTVRDVGGKALPVNGDDWTNQQLGYAGRWWDDTNPPSTNLDDAYFQANYPRHTVYGYIFMGDFVTDAAGSADVDIAADHSYHITWQDAQTGAKEAEFGTFSVGSTAPFYGYGRAIPSRAIKLWYEYEPSRARSVVLAPGTYHCRLLVTEEAFHGAGGSGGGIWKTVLATEERDQNPNNDIVFTIAR